jgi:hypothetical protein
VRVISFKNEALQTLSISKDLAWNPLTFRVKEIDESVDCGGKTLVKQRIRLGQFGVTAQRRQSRSDAPRAEKQRRLRRVLHLLAGLKLCSG